MVDCIYYIQVGKLEECVIIKYCKSPDRCGLREEQAHKPTEEELRDIWKGEEE